MRIPRLLTALVLGALLAASPAEAGSVYLNNVNIDGVTSQKFEKVNVRIDEKGNVFIDAPGYQVRAVEGAPPKEEPAPAVARVTRRYWLVTEQSVPGMTDFDIDLYVNSRWIRKLKNSEEQIVTEITKHLSPGKNTILLIAHKLPASGARRSLSPEHVFRVIIGEGNVGGDNVMIDNPIVKFERTAADSQDVSREFMLITR